MKRQTVAAGVGVAVAIGTGLVWLNAAQVSSESGSASEAVVVPAPLPMAEHPLGRIPRLPPTALARRIDLPDRAVASSGNAREATDGNPDTAWIPAKHQPAWLAMPLASRHAARLVVAWQAVGFRYPYYRTAPKAYRLLVSSDSTNGRDGTWQLVETVRQNAVRTRAHVLRTPTATWLRLQVDANWSVAPSLSEVAIYDVPESGPVGCYLVLGDSITCASLNRFQATTGVAGSPQRRHPVFLNGGSNGISTIQGLDDLRLALAMSPPQSHIGIALGTNDGLKHFPPAEFADRLQRMIDAIRLSGRVPVLARPPWTPVSDLGTYVSVVDRLVQANGLPAGPDLFAWFQAHPGEIGPDGVHPTPVGEASIRRLWNLAAGTAG